MGVSLRGKIPAIRCFLLLDEPMTTEQLEDALAMDEAAAAAPDSPTLFFFFDFDRTLSLLDGLDMTETLETLFGDEQRRESMRKLLKALLEAKRCYVLTANSGYRLISMWLNELLCVPVDSSPATYPQFVVDDTIRYVHAGGKIRVIKHIVHRRGFQLTTVFR
jgi:hypothetical protein